MVNPQIDDYIAKAQPFAQPILTHIRMLVHKACPQVEEKMKWSFPHFDYKGEMMCSMAAFKQHCAFNLWKASIMNDPKLIENAKTEQSMGHLGKLCSLKDLPADKQMIAYVKEAMQLNEKGVKIKKDKPAPVAVMQVPDYFAKALAKNKMAKAHFENFTPGAKKEYIVWLTDAKSEDIRNKRMADALEWISQGKKRNWKYEVKK
jgi:uncharacterized protein YdeI (YjbR/CyaY-like superfamily)